MSAKSKKKGERILLLPGASGWEAWTGANGGGLNLAMRTGEQLVLDVDGVPSGDLSMAFPVRDVSALPFLAPTTDEALFADLADMHVERLGMRPAAEAGVLSDCFRVGQRGENSLLLPVVLAPPPEGHLPKRSPQNFDISARCLPLPATGVVVWRELGRWVFAVSEEGRPLHFQALAATELGLEAGREIRISLSQLELQGLFESAPKHCFVWVGEEEPTPTAAMLEGLGQGFGGTAMVAEKPAPVLPPKPSQLLPADVRAERLAKRQKQQATFALVALGVVYLGLIGWAAWTLVEARKDLAAVQREVDEFGPELAAMALHEQKWNELEPLVNTKHSPMELLLACAKARPDQGLRWDFAEVQCNLGIDQGELTTVNRTIRLQGKADEMAQVTTFNANLKRSDLLRDNVSYIWRTPVATEDSASGRWQFLYDAEYIPPTP